MRRSASVLVAVLLATCSDSREADVAKALIAAEEAARQGDLAHALSLVGEELAAHPATDDSDVAWRLRLLQADLLVRRRDIDAAAHVVEAQLPGHAALDSARARQQYLKARIAVERGDYDRGMAVALDARNQVGVDTDTIGDVDLLVGRIHLQHGRWKEAESVLAHVLSPTGDRYRQLQALTNLGFGRLRTGRYDEALTWLERALGLSDFERTQAYATAMANAGICYSRLGMFDRAAHIQRRAVEIQRAQGGTKALVEALGSLGVTHGLQGDFEQALGYFQQAFAAAQGVGLSSDASLWAGNMASAHARLHNWDEAERANQQSETLAGGQQSSPYHLLNDAQIAVGRGQLDVARALYEQVRSGAAAASLHWTSEAGLAKVALQAGHGSEANRHFETALGVLDRTRLELARTDYRLSFLTQLIEFYQEYVDALVGQGRSDRALEIADSSRGRVLAERQRVDAPARVTAAMFQRVAARTKATLLSYWLAPQRSFLWVITGSGIRRIDLPPAEEIETAVREYRALVDNSMANPIDKAGTAGDRLYQMLVAPAKIPPGASVVIVPDGALHSINFETLPVDGPVRRYWIEDVQVQVAPSLAMLTVDTGKTPSDGQLLLIGNPTPRAPDFPALSYAPAEMTGIVRSFPQGRVTAYESTKATPAVYQEAPLDRFSMIHFTAHAVTNVESPLDSAVVLSGPDTAYKLYARDVAEKPLKADLVTVSACRSAGERAYSGEGLVGFAWAFLRAGARRVVAGLWDVDDRSTAQLMSALYGGVAKGQPPAAALRAAKLDLITQGGQLARPYYWGPFQLFTVTP